MKIALYCGCGSALEGIVPKDTVPKLVEFWRNEHVSPECREVGREEAEDAYRRKTHSSFAPFPDEQ